jgi:hypothetical protein
MKIEKQIVGFSVALLAMLSAQAQGTFQNLNFEQADPMSAGNPANPYAVTATTALPYWTVTIGGAQQTQVTYNAGSLGAPVVVLLGPPPPAPAFNPIDGNYSVLLTGSFSASVPSISQTGTIPAGTQSLLFEAEPGVSPPTGALELQIGTQSVTFSAVGMGPNYTLYGANISAWAGQTESLTFSASETSSGLNNWELDDISFSTTAIPEPSPLALTGVGAVLLALYRRFVPKGSP